MVERVVGVGLQEQKVEAEDDCTDAKDGLPVCTQDVQTHIALQVNIGVVDLGVAVHLGRLMRVVSRHCEGEVVLCSTPQGRPFLDCQINIELHDVIRLSEVDSGVLGQIQFV